MSMRELSERLKNWRCERPDEWTMDEFIRLALAMEYRSEQSAEELAALRAQRDELAEACKKMAEWDAREKDHAIDFYARLALCDEAFSMMRAVLAKLEVKP